MVKLPEPERELSSDFNEAWFQIERLSNLYLDANRFSKQGRFDEWLWVLDNIWRELAVDALKLRMYQEHIDIMKISAEVIKAKREGNRPKYYLKLQEKEILLRQLAEETGKGSKRTDKADAMM